MEHQDRDPDHGNKQDQVQKYHPAEDGRQQFVLFKGGGGYFQFVVQPIFVLEEGGHYPGGFGFFLFGDIDFGIVILQPGMGAGVERIYRCDGIAVVRAFVELG